MRSRHQIASSTATTRSIRHRLLLLSLLLLVPSAAATAAAIGMPRAQGFILSPLRRHRRGLSVAAAATPTAAPAALSPPQPQLQPPPGPALSLNTEAGEALLRRIWGVDSVNVVSPSEWRAAAERHRCVHCSLIDGYHAD